ncbi:MAG: NADH-quinone oxidoreductase subunit J [Anaerolineales bacterium]|nr:NADH-quinone oxidoreductase subunit J [Anaerolineales bacterium]
MADYILFFGLAVVAIASAVGLLLSKNAVYAALNLVINFVAVAVFYVLLDAPFIALVQIAVYAGAIMVLFLFVIMLLGAERLGQGPALPWQRPLAVVMAVALLLEAAYLLAARWGTIAQAGAVGADFGSPAAVGEMLFNVYLLPFEVVSILLLVAMIGAIVLTRRSERAG